MEAILDQGTLKVDINRQCLPQSCAWAFICNSGLQQFGSTCPQVWGLYPETTRGFLRGTCMNS